MQNPTKESKEKIKKMKNCGVNKKFNLVNNYKLR